MSGAAPAPAYWISKLADAALEALARGDWVGMQEQLRAEAAAHGLEPALLAKLVAEEWDRIGFVSGERRRLVPEPRP